MLLSENSTTITGSSELPDALNYSVLNTLGLETVIETGSDNWTDYNSHDPGTTTLEILTLAHHQQRPASSPKKQKTLQHAGNTLFIGGQN